MNDGVGGRSGRSVCSYDGHHVLRATAGEKKKTMNQKQPSTVQLFARKLLFKMKYYIHDNNCPHKVQSFYFRQERIDCYPRLHCRNETNGILVLDEPC